jgi:hypothetical protein
MRVGDVVVLVPLCVLAVESHATAQPTMSRVTVRVYEVPSLDARLKATALDVASAALASALVDVSWKPCTAPAGASACDTPPGGDLVVRLVRSTVERRDETVPLGDAHVDTGSGSAVLATVYIDRVARVAKASGMDQGTLLGYAVAHELGHLLLARDTHGVRGLMRSVWRDDELRSDRKTDWAFTAEETTAIRDRLAGH